MHQVQGPWCVLLGGTNRHLLVLKESTVWQGRDEVHAKQYHRRWTAKGASELNFGCLCLSTFFFVEVRLIFVVVLWKSINLSHLIFEFVFLPRLLLCPHTRWVLGYYLLMKVACVLVYKAPSIHMHWFIPLFLKVCAKKQGVDFLDWPQLTKSDSLKVDLRSLNFKQVLTLSFPTTSPAIFMNRKIWSNCLTWSL